MENFFVTLPGRGFVRVGGHDRLRFLQGLITNDLTFLGQQPCLYACLLNAHGKFLHDFFVTVEENSFLLECEGEARAADLLKRLQNYKLRSNIELTAIPEAPVYAAYSSDHSGYPDPRHPGLGGRTFVKPENLAERPFPVWDERRIRLGIPDGSRDLIPEQSTPDEGRLDRLNAISFTKGCYTGQELTARMHHRGLGKKHLYPVEARPSAELPTSGVGIFINGILAGTMRSSCGPVGLALLKDEIVPDFQHDIVRVI